MITIETLEKKMYELNKQLRMVRVEGKSSELVTSLAEYGWDAITEKLNERASASLNGDSKIEDSIWIDMTREQPLASTLIRYRIGSAISQGAINRTYSKLDDIEAVLEDI